MTSNCSEKFVVDVRNLFKKFGGIKRLNKFLENKTGVTEFFKSLEDLKRFKQFLDSFSNVNTGSGDLGDFQTPTHVTDKICEYLIGIGFTPDVIIEPTCGKGNFIISALRFFPTLKYVYCLEIQSKYEWLFKLNMLRLSFDQNIHVKIEFHRDNVFTHRITGRFTSILKKRPQNLLILGNPPWITSSMLSVLNSSNLPSKVNIKKYKGMDAITGKSNFDIAENIILQMIQRFCDKRGKIAMLCKTSVIRNIVRDMHKLNLKICNFRVLLIDAAKEFNINADAGLFVADFGLHGDTSCIVSSLYEPKIELKRFGWIRHKFVSNMKSYRKYAYLDGQSPLEWRHGVKHDASKVMILKTVDDGLLNNLQEYVEVEKDLLYPFVKGSELKRRVIRNTVKKIIVTQMSLREDTNAIRPKYPRLWNYLISHSKYFDKRKSLVYKKRPKFSIFGIGDYSFSPYKVAIPGLYKEPIFSLIFPVDNKPVMLDDTCYYLSFDSLNDAFFTWILLNMDAVKNFLSCIAFLVAKRPYTKEILMRIDLMRLAERLSFDDVLNAYRKVQKKYLEHRFNARDFLNFKNSLQTDRLL